MCTNLPEERLVYWRSRLHNHFFLSNYRTFMRDPKFIVGGFKIFLKGLPGLVPGIKRFIKTRKFDNILIQVLKEYRRRLKQLTQYQVT